MRLTKTQSAILSREYKGFVCTSRGSGRGALGGRVVFGRRESAAAIALRDMGLLEFVKHDSEIVYANGNGIHITDTKWRVISKESDNG
jgi:hypothetical protein